VISPIIFLDVDGVVAPFVDRYQYGQVSPSCIQVLNEIVTRSGALIVVSSSLRYGKTVAELQELLDDFGFTGHVVDKTPTDMPGASRGEEISAWLATHPTSRCVILDDHRDMGGLLDVLVQTEPALGLQPGDVERALEKLAREMSATPNGAGVPASSDG
jgi:hypothetical protein